MRETPMTMTIAEKPVRVLPADVYDALEFAALAFDGIGTGPPFLNPISYWLPPERDCPNCAHGLAVYAATNGGPVLYEDIDAAQGVGPISRALFRAGIDGYTSDDAVQAVRKRRDSYDLDTRVSFADWCRELGVVRGES